MNQLCSSSPRIQSGFLPMGDETQWKWQNTNNSEDKEPQFEPFERENELKSNDTITSLNSLLPNDILMKIFSSLPIATLIRVRFVCKRWHETVHSGLIQMPPQKPWYLMLTSINNIATYSYDSTFKTWYTFDFLSLYKRHMFISSSCGLISFIDYEYYNRIFVCNPITRERKKLHQPQNETFSNYIALTLSVDRFSCDYTIVVVKSKPVSGDIHLWDISIMIYESKSRLWKASINESLIGWRGGDESVICRGILYFIVHSCSWNNELPLRLVFYELHSNSSCNSLMQRMIMEPYPLTSCRLMNLRERLVLVGGIGKRWKPNVLKRISILELRGEEWEEIGSISRKFFSGLWSSDDGFVSSGAGDLILIHSNGSPELVIFDINKNKWNWTARYPVINQYPLQRFMGFCFEPRLNITS